MSFQYKRLDVYNVRFVTCYVRTYCINPIPSMESNNMKPHYLALAFAEDFRGSGNVICINSKGGQAKLQLK